MQTACTRANEVLAGAPLDDGNIDPRQRQLTCQHQPCWASSSNHHRVIASARPVRRQHDTQFAALKSGRFWPRPAILQHDPGLAASPPAPDIVREGRGMPLPFYLSFAAWMDDDPTRSV